MPESAWVSTSSVKKTLVMDSSRMRGSCIEVAGGQWSVVSWAVGSWQLAVVSGQWSVGQLAVVSGQCQWSVVSWQLAVGSGQWAVGSCLFARRRARTWRLWGAMKTNFEKLRVYQLAEEIADRI